MKKILTLGFLISMNVLGGEKILINDSKTMNADLNEATVRCSAIGYGASELKINLKGLDGWTLFDHSNVNAGDINGQPCMTAGFCKFGRSIPGLSIDDILSGGDRTETVVVSRQLIEFKNIVKDENGVEACARHIEERLAASVTRGDGNGKIDFTHSRIGLFENFPVSSCN